MSVIGASKHGMRKHRYEITVEAESDVDAVVTFDESYDDDVVYTEAYDVHQYDKNTFGVFFWSEEPVRVAGQPLIHRVDE